MLKLALNLFRSGGLKQIFALMKRKILFLSVPPRLACSVYSKFTNKNELYGDTKNTIPVTEIKNDLSKTNAAEMLRYREKLVEATHFEQRDEHEHALTAYEAAIAILPTMLTPYLRKMILQAQLGRNTEVREQFNEIRGKLLTEIKPVKRDFLNLAQIYAYLGYDAEALETLDRAINHNAMNKIIAVTDVKGFFFRLKDNKEFRKITAR